MKFYNGMVPLEDLVEYVMSTDPEGYSLRGDSHAGRTYGKLAKEATAQVADDAGIYRWGTYRPSGEWVDIYVGKAFRTPKGNLRARLLEELKDEKHFLWRSVHSEEKLLHIGEQNYSPMWFRYHNHWKLALKKTGATHIAWVATPELDAKQVDNLENELINFLSPSANQKRPVCFVPSGVVRSGVLRHFNEIIEKHRAV